MTFTIQYSNQHNAEVAWGIFNYERNKSIEKREEFKINFIFLDN